MTSRGAFILIASLLAGLCEASEWRTAGGFHCTERCTVRDLDWDGRKLEAVLTCPVVDGESTEWRPRRTSDSGRPCVTGECEAGREPEEGYSEDDLQFWDFCTPASLEALQQGGEAEAEAVTLPANLGDSGSGYNPGSGSHRRAASSLAGVYCEAECRDMMAGPDGRDRHSCAVSGHALDAFYCSPQVPLVRSRLTSRNKLWCTSPCTRRDARDPYTCRTMFGVDYCSPSEDKSYSGRMCVGSCKEDSHEDEEGHYKCYVDQMRSEKEHCGPVAGSPDLPRAVTHALEYSNQGRVCAGPCSDRDGSLMCDVVTWEWDEDRQKADLVLGVEYCGLEGSSTAKTVGIVVGCVLAALAIVALVAFVVARKKYDSVRTTETGP